MTRKTAAILVGLGVAGVGFAVFIWVQAWGAAEVIPAVIVAAVAFLLLAIGVGKLQRPAFGVALFVVGVAGALALIPLEQAREAAIMADIHRELGVSAAAVAVCNGTPNPAAAPPRGRRPILQVITWPDDTSTSTKLGTAWDGLPAPATAGELQLVVCREVAHDIVASCAYNSKGGSSGAAAYTIFKARRSDTLVVRDARTAQVLGEQTFEGTPPSDRCDDSIVTRGRREMSTTSTGDAPSDRDMTAFLARFVTPAEN